MGFRLRELIRLSGRWWQYLTDQRKRRWLIRIGRLGLVPTISGAAGPTLVQVGSIVVTSGASDWIPTLTSASTAGNLLIACLAAGNGGQVNTAPSGWVRATGLTNSGAGLDVWYYPNNPGGITSADFTKTVSNAGLCFMEEWSGIVTTSPLDASATGSGSAGTCTASISASTSGDLALSFFFQNLTASSTVTFTPGSGWTNVTNNGSTNRYTHITGDYQTGAGTAPSETQTSSATNTYSSGFLGVLVTFKVPASTQGYRDAATRFSLTTLPVPGPRYQRPDQLIRPGQVNLQIEQTIWTLLARSLAVAVQGAQQAYRDTTIRFSLQVLAFRDAAIRFSLAVRSWRDVSTRFSLRATGFRDAAIRFSLAVRSWRDVSTRFSLTVRGFRDAAIRFSLATAGTFRDAATRFSLAVRGFRDAATRFSVFPRGYRDAQLRFSLAVRGFRDAATRFRLVVQSYRDAAVRFSLRVTGYRDAAVRFSLAIRAYRDAAARFALQARSFRDAAIRFSLSTPGVYRDAAVRFSLRAVGFRDAAVRFDLALRGFQNAMVRFSLRVASYRDAAVRASIRAIGYRDSAIRFRLQVRAWRDAVVRFSLFLRGFRDAATRFSLRGLAFKDTQLRFILGAATPTFITVEISARSGQEGISARSGQEGILT